MTTQRDISEAPDLWGLDPAVTFLNHGSFGATPTAVLAEQARLRSLLEANPVDFFERRLEGLLASARTSLAVFLDADPAGLAFVRNATTGVNTVLAGLGLGPGDEVVYADHSYPAVANTVEQTCARTGATAVPVAVPLPGEEMAARLIAAIGGRTALVVVDAVTSATGVIVDAGAVVAACGARGVPVLVDAAHAPAMLPVSLEAMDPDFWTGNFHKWPSAPKGAGVLWVAARHRETLRPLVTSQPWLDTFRTAFDWTGTDDPSAILSAPVALDLLASFGWDEIRARNHALAIDGRRLVQDAIGGAVPVPDDLHGWMAIIALPDGIATTREAAIALRERLFAEHRIEVPVSAWNGRGLVRVSAHLYNRIEDYERLAAALPTLL